MDYVKRPITMPLMIIQNLLPEKKPALRLHSSSAAQVSLAEVSRSAEAGPAESLVDGDAGLAEIACAPLSESGNDGCSDRCGATAVSGISGAASDEELRKVKPNRSMMRLFGVFFVLSMLASVALNIGEFDNFTQAPDRLVSSMWEEVAGQGEYGFEEARRKALKKCALAAKRGYACGWTAMGYIYSLADFDREKSRRAYENGVLAGDPMAMHNLAFDYQTGAFSRYRIADAAANRKSLELFRMAFDKHRYPPSAAALASVYAYGAEGIEPDERKAFYYLKQAADLSEGDWQPWLSLAEAYKKGFGTEVSLPKYFDCLRHAESMGSPQASMKLGDSYFYGIDTPIDYKRARQHYEKARKNGGCLATMQLGRMFEGGLGVAKDLRQAYKFYKCTVDDNVDTSVQPNLRLTALKLKLASNGEQRQELERDLKAIFTLLKEQATNCPEAWNVYLLGECYEYGYGVAPNLNAAIHCYTESAALNQVEAKVALMRLGRKLPPVEPSSEDSQIPMLCTGYSSPQ